MKLKTRSQDIEVYSTNIQSLTNDKLLDEYVGCKDKIDLLKREIDKRFSLTYPDFSFDNVKATPYIIKIKFLSGESHV